MTEIYEELMVGYYSKAVKLLDTKKGVRYYQNFNGRFLPLAKKKFEALDLAVVPVYQLLPGMGWIQINTTRAD